jgi:phosphoglycolate phosphatase-like HAD superfamily hydrolase
MELAGGFEQGCQQCGLRYSPGVIRNIIFDWSGTLVDDLPAVWEATNHVFSQAGIPEITLDRFRAEFCLPFTRFYERYTPHVPMAQLEEWFHGRFRQAQGSVQPLPFARPAAARTRVFGVLPRAKGADVCPEHGASRAFRRAK